LRTMNATGDQFVMDGSGNKTAVLVRIDRYAELIEAQEELDSIRAYDAAKASNNETIPVAQEPNAGASLTQRYQLPTTACNTCRNGLIPAQGAGGVLQREREELGVSRVQLAILFG